MGDPGVRNFHELGFSAAQQGMEVGVAELLELSFSYQLCTFALSHGGASQIWSPHRQGIRDPWDVSPEPEHRSSRELLPCWV